MAVAGAVLQLRSGRVRYDVRRYRTQRAMAVNGGALCGVRYRFIDFYGSLVPQVLIRYGWNASLSSRKLYQFRRLKTTPRSILPKSTITSTVIQKCDSKIVRERGHQEPQQGKEDAEGTRSLTVI